MPYMDAMGIWRAHLPQCRSGIFEETRQVFTWLMILWGFTSSGNMYITNPTICLLGNVRKQTIQWVFPCLTIPNFTEQSRVRRCSFCPALTQTIFQFFSHIASIKLVHPWICLLGDFWLTDSRKSPWDEIFTMSRQPAKSKPKKWVSDFRCVTGVSHWNPTGLVLGFLFPLNYPFGGIQQYKCMAISCQ